MPGRIAGDFAGTRQRKIGIRNQKTLFIAEQSRNDLSARINDACAAIVIEFIERLIFNWHVLLHPDARGADHPRRRLTGESTAKKKLARPYGLFRSLFRFSPRPRRNVYVHALSHQRVGGQNGIMLPAIE